MKISIEKIEKERKKTGPNGHGTGGEGRAIGENPCL